MDLIIYFNLFFIVVLQSYTSGHKFNKLTMVDLIYHLSIFENKNPIYHYINFLKNII
jgi:hypothetical protein